MALSRYRGLYRTCYGSWTSALGAEALKASLPKVQGRNLSFWLSAEESLCGHPLCRPAGHFLLLLSAALPKAENCEPGNQRYKYRFHAHQGRGPIQQTVDRSWDFLQQSSSLFQLPLTACFSMTWDDFRAFDHQARHSSENPGAS